MTSPGRPCVWALLWVSILYCPFHEDAWLTRLNCAEVSLMVLNSHMKQSGNLPQVLPVWFRRCCFPKPSTYLPFSCLSPGQVVVEVIQLVRLLFQGLCAQTGSDPRSLPQGTPLLCQSKELGKGLMITIPQHLHTDVLRYEFR